MSSLLRLDVDAIEWIEFQDYIQNNYPRDNFTKEQKDFIKHNLLQDNGKCSDLNKLWIIVFVQHLMDLLEKSWVRHAGTLVELTEHVKISTSRAIFEFFNSQYSIREHTPSSRRSDEEVRMLSIHPNILNFPLELGLDMLYYLLNEEWKLKLRPVCLHVQAIGSKIETTPEEERIEKTAAIASPSKLSPKIPPATPKKRKTATKKTPLTTKISLPVVSKSISTPTESAKVTWNPHKKDHEYVRLCLYYTWACKYAPEEYLSLPTSSVSSLSPPKTLPDCSSVEDWSGGKMCEDWLREALEVYDYLRQTIWSAIQPPLPTYDVHGADFYAIRKTVMHTWLKDWLVPTTPIPSRQLKEWRKQAESEVFPPSTSWMIEKIGSFSDSGLRIAWEEYYHWIVMKAYVSSLDAPTTSAATVPAPITSPIIPTATVSKATDTSIERERNEEERVVDVEGMPALSMDILEDGWWDVDQVGPSMKTNTTNTKITPSPRIRSPSFPLSPPLSSAITSTVFPVRTPTNPMNTHDDTTFSLVRQRYNAEDEVKRQEASRREKEWDSGIEDKHKSVTTQVVSPVGKQQQQKKTLLVSPRKASSRLLPRITEESDEMEEEEEIEEEEEEALSPSLFFSSSRSKVKQSASSVFDEKQGKTMKKETMKEVKNEEKMVIVEEEEKEAFREQPLTNGSSSNPKRRRRKRSGLYQPM